MFFLIPVCFDRQRFGASFVWWLGGEERKGYCSGGWEERKGTAAVLMAGLEMAGAGNGGLSVARGKTGEWGKNEGEGPLSRRRRKGRRRCWLAAERESGKKMGGGAAAQPLILKKIRFWGFF